MTRTPTLPQARAVAFASIVTTQLAQTLEAGRAEGSLTRPVLGAVTGSAGLLVATLAVPTLRDLLLLATPGALGWALIAAGGPAAVLLNRLLAAPRGNGSPLPVLPAPPSPRRIPSPVAVP